MTERVVRARSRSVTLADSTEYAADLGVGRDAAVVRDQRGPFHLVEVVQLYPLPQPDVAAEADSRNPERDVLVERVEVRLPVLVEVADVLPVAVHDEPVERASHLQQEREELLREVVRPVGRDVLEHLGLEHVDARVDRVREDLAPRGLLEEALDAAVVVGDHDPELERVLDGLEPDRDRRPTLLVEFDEAGEVEVAERVAGDDEKRLVELVRREADGAGCARGRFLDGVLDVHAQALAVAEVAPDRLREKGDGDDHFVEAVAAEKLDDVLHAGLADDRDHRLRLVRRERPEARALPAGHDDGLHASRSSHDRVDVLGSGGQCEARARSRSTRAATPCPRA